MAKNTYGTGFRFALTNTGEKACTENGLLTTIACGPSGEVNYALEGGAVFMAGASIQWLRDSRSSSATLPDPNISPPKVKDTNGVHVVPAFTGSLGAPYWGPVCPRRQFGLTSRREL